MLKLQRRKQPTQFVKLASSSLTIGRDESNIFVLDAPSVSDFHAEISCENEQHFITDLVSGGGTFVNGNRIANRTSIKAWDSIRLGSIELDVVDPSQHHPDEWALKGTSTEVANQYFQLSQVLSVLGRDASCDLRVDNAMLSRQHAEIHLIDNRLKIVDLDSSNGTFVNDSKVSESELRPGDEVRFDKLVYLVVGPKLGTAAPETDDDRTLIRMADSDQTVLGARIPAATTHSDASIPPATSDEEPQVDKMSTGQKKPEKADDHDQPAPKRITEHKVQAVPAPKSAQQAPEVEAPSATDAAQHEDATRLFLTTVSSARLIATAGEKSSYELQVPEINVGRSTSNALTLGDSSVSKRHAVLSFKAGQWRIKDNNSRNGTLHNGKIIEASVTLRHGDIIKLGRLEYRFELDAPDAASASLANPAADPQATAIYDGPLITQSPADSQAGRTNDVWRQLQRYRHAAIALVLLGLAALFLM